MAIDRAGATRIAVAHDGVEVDVGGLRETKHGWFFPCVADGPVGSNGVIVGKDNGAVFALGSAYPVERDIRFYDRGFRSKGYDLVILEVFDRRAASSLLQRIGPTVVEVSDEGGTVWRVPRPLTEDEIERRLASLPCVFADVALYHRLEVLEQAELERAFTYDAIPVDGRGRPDPDPPRAPLS